MKTEMQLPLVPHLDWHARINALEKELLTEALTLTNGNRAHAAVVLKISRTTFGERLRKHGLGKK